MARLKKDARFFPEMKSFIRTEAKKKKKINKKFQDHLGYMESSVKFL